MLSLHTEEGIGQMYVTATLLHHKYTKALSHKDLPPLE